MCERVNVKEVRNLKEGVVIKGRGYTDQGVKCRGLGGNMCV